MPDEVTPQGTYITLETGPTIPTRLALEEALVLAGRGPVAFLQGQAFRLVREMLVMSQDPDDLRTRLQTIRTTFGLDLSPEVLSQVYVNALQIATTPLLTAAALGGEPVQREEISPPPSKRGTGGYVFIR